MDWNNIDEIILKFQEKELEQIPLNVIIERIEKVRTTTMKPDLGMPLLITSEREPKRKKLFVILHTMEAIRDKKQIEQDNEDATKKEVWKAETLKTQLPNIRFAYGTEIEHLLHQDYTIDVIHWETPISTEIMVDKRKVDLLKTITPQILNMIMEKPFSPVYFTLQPAGIFRKGELQGAWYDGMDYTRSRNDVYKPRLLLAVMRV